MERQEARRLAPVLKELSIKMRGYARALRAEGRGQIPDPVKTKVASEQDVQNAIERVLARYEIKPDAPPPSALPPDAAVVHKTLRDILQEMIPPILEREAKKVLGSVRSVELKTKNETKKLKGVMPECFEQMLKLASQRINILLVGPSGCGKTYVAKRLAEALSARRFGAVSCSAGMSESQLAGWLLPTGSAGKFEYAPSLFVDIYENGGVFLFDELDAADPNAVTFINAALSGDPAGDELFIPQRLDAQVVKRHKDCVVMAAANTYGNGADALYVGRNQLDAATLERFRVGTVRMDYDDAVETSVGDADVLKWARTVRSKIREHGMLKIMSKIGRAHV